jgi:hypothetical protein
MQLGNLGKEVLSHSLASVGMERVLLLVKASGQHVGRPSKEESTSISNPHV